jgi:hypothetical protein
MKCYFRLLTAVVLAVAISLPSVALATPQARDRGDKSPVVRIVAKIRKFFGITTHDDLPLPPPPTNPK